MFYPSLLWSMTIGYLSTLITPDSQGFLLGVIGSYSLHYPCDICWTGKSSFFIRTSWSEFITLDDVYSLDQMWDYKTIYFLSPLPCTSNSDTVLPIWEVHSAAQPALRKGHQTGPALVHQCPYDHWSFDYVSHISCFTYICSLAHDQFSAVSGDYWATKPNSSSAEVTSLMVFVFKAHSFPARQKWRECILGSQERAAHRLASLCVSWLFNHINLEALNHGNLINIQLRILVICENMGC